MSNGVLSAGCTCEVVVMRMVNALLGLPERELSITESPPRKLWRAFNLRTVLSDYVLNELLGCTHRKEATNVHYGDKLGQVDATHKGKAYSLWVWTGYLEISDYQASLHTIKAITKRKFIFKLRQNDILQTALSKNKHWTHTSVRLKKIKYKYEISPG